MHAALRFAFSNRRCQHIYQCPKSKWHFAQFIKSFLFSVLVCAFICFYSMTERELNFVTCVEEELLNIGLQLTLMNNPRHSRDRVDSESVSRVGVWLDSTGAELFWNKQTNWQTHRQTLNFVLLSKWSPGLAHLRHCNAAVTTTTRLPFECCSTPIRRPTLRPYRPRRFTYVAG